MSSIRPSILVALALLAPHLGLAQDKYAAPIPTVASWVETCRERTQPPREMTRVYTWETGFVVEVSTAAGPLRIELTSETSSRFVQTPELGLAPVGEFAEWEDEAADRQQALRDLTACAEALGAPRWPGPALPTTEPDSPPPDPPAPWVPLAALLGTLVVLWYRRHKLRTVDVVAAAGMAVAVGLFWWLALPSGFFHPNGHGPTWVLYTVRGHTGLTRYGPGFPWLWSWLATLDPARADRLVLAGQLGLGVAGVVASYVVVRRQIDSPLTSSALVGVASLSPVWGRVSQSESYFGTIASLLFISAAVASLARDHHLRSRRFRGLCCLAGLWAGLAASVHPVGWVPASLVVFAIPSLREPWNTTCRQLVHGGSWFGVICLGVAASSIAATFESGLGGQWTARLSIWPGVVLAGGLIGAFVWLLRIRASDGDTGHAQRATAVCLPLVVAYGTFVLQAERAVYTVAFIELHRPAVLAATAALVAVSSPLDGTRRRWWFGLAALGLLAQLTVLPWARELPTDAQEAAWAADWRTTVSPEHPVVWLSRAGLRNVDLPIYDDRRRPMDAVDFRTVRVAPGTTYYRSSLCDTQEGRQACAEFEGRHRLEPIAERSLPALPSRPELQPYEVDILEVGVYRVLR